MSVAARWSKYGLCWGSLGLWAACAFAQDIPASSEQDYLQSFPVVLSASRLSQPQSEAPNAMTIIDRQMIEDSGFRKISDLFRMVPGMYVGNTDGYTASVSYHGLTDMYSRRMQVLIDGRSIYMPPFGGVDWADIPLLVADIERIEVIRGPAAASHGSNSLQGVINIITREASSQSGRKVSVSRGGQGVSDLSLQAGASGASWDARTSLGYRADEGFPASVLNDGITSRLINSRLNYRVNDADAIDTQVGYNESVFGAGVDINDPAQSPRNARSYSGFMQTVWSHVWAQGDESRLSYSYNYRNFLDGVVVLNTPVRLDMLSHRSELEFQQSTELSSTHRVVWGGGMRQDAAEASLVMNPRQQITQSRVFMHDEWRASERMLLNAGGMYENDGMGHKHVSPRLSVNYHVQPQQTLRAGVSTAYRNPGLVEDRSNAVTFFLPLSYQPFRAGGNLMSEKVISREIGYLGELPEISTTIDARIYFDHISDIIYIDPQIPAAVAPATASFGGTNGFANLMSASYKGIETTIKYRWSEQGGLVLNASHQVASCDATGSMTLPAANAYLQSWVDQCPLTVPLNSGSALLSQDVGQGLRLSAAYYFQGAMQVLDALEPQSVMRRVDLKVAQSFGKPGKLGSGNVSLVVQNALQNRYADYTNSSAKVGLLYFDRLAYITLSLDL